MTRTFTNKPGVEFDEAKTSVVFAEDMNDIFSRIEALEAGGGGTSFVITSSAGSNGSIDPVGDVSVDSGADQVFTITADEGFEVDTVLVDGETASLTDGTYTFENVLADHTIEVSFVSSGSSPAFTGSGFGNSNANVAWYEDGSQAGHAKYTNLVNGWVIVGDGAIWRIESVLNVVADYVSTGWNEDPTLCTYEVGTGTSPAGTLS